MYHRQGGLIYRWVLQFMYQTGRPYLQVGLTVHVPDRAALFTGGSYSSCTRQGGLIYRWVLQFMYQTGRPYLQVGLTVHVPDRAALFTGGSYSSCTTDRAALFTGGSYSSCTRQGGLIYRWVLQFMYQTGQPYLQVGLTVHVPDRAALFTGGSYSSCTRQGGLIYRWVLCNDYKHCRNDDTETKLPYLCIFILESTRDTE